MAQRIILSLDIDDYAAFTGGSIAVPFTERQAAIVSSVFQLVLERDSWQPMSDAQWNNVEAFLTNISENLTP